MILMREVCSSILCMFTQKYAPTESSRAYFQVSVHGMVALSVLDSLVEINGAESASFGFLPERLKVCPCDYFIWGGGHSISLPSCSFVLYIYLKPFHITLIQNIPQFFHFISLSVCMLKSVIGYHLLLSWNHYVLVWKRWSVLQSWCSLSIDTHACLPWKASVSVQVMQIMIMVFPSTATRDSLTGDQNWNFLEVMHAKSLSCDSATITYMQRIDRSSGQTPHNRAIHQAPYVKIIIIKNSRPHPTSSEQGKGYMSGFEFWLFLQE